MPVVTNTIKYPNGTLAAGRVTIDLVGENGRPLSDGAFVSGSDYAIESSYAADLATSAPSWSVTLVANSLISPEGTRWRVREHVNGQPTMYYIEVPDGAGPYFVEDILDEAPGSIGSSALSYLRSLVVHEGALSWLDTRVGGIMDAGASDQSDAINAAMTLLAAGDGGELEIPAGEISWSDQVIIPNDGQSTPSQPPIRIRGAGSGADPLGGVALGGTIINLPYDGAGVAKIDSRGKGILELCDLTLQDSTTSDVPFVQVTNTMLVAHDLHLNGRNRTDGQDGIVLGGGTRTTDGTATGKYNGYGTVIERVHFDRLRSAIVGKPGANGAVIRDNSIWNTCGGDATHAAIEFFGNAEGSVSGNVILANIIECTNYVYGVRLDFARMNNIVNNSFYDPQGSTLAYVRFEADALYNLVIMAFGDATVEAMSEAVAARNTLITPWQSEPSQFPQGADFSANSRFVGASVFRLDDGSGNLWALASESSGNRFRIRYQPSGGSFSDALKIDRTHLLGQGTVPAGAALASFGNAPSSVVVAGSDLAGTITATSGSSATAAGNILDLVFAIAYGSALGKVQITPGNAAAAALRTYVAQSLTSKFTIGTLDAPATSTEYVWNYLIVQ